MSKNCPCCKITRTLQEYQRHPSITSFKSLENACAGMGGNPTERNVKLIRGCDHHSREGILGNWWDNVLADARGCLERGFVIRHLRSTL